MFNVHHSTWLSHWIPATVTSPVWACPWQTGQGDRPLTPVLASMASPGPSSATQAGFRRRCRLIWLQIRLNVAGAVADAVAVSVTYVTAVTVVTSLSRGAAGCCCRCCRQQQHHLVYLELQRNGLLTLQWCRGGLPVQALCPGW